MPIKGLTDLGQRLPRLGIIRKGGPKTNPKAPGPDLDYFRLDTKDEEIAQTWTRIYGEKPTQITVLLPYATTDECFESWMEEWTAQGLLRRCDGQKINLWLTPENSYSRVEMPCKKSEERCDCKPVGRLHAILPGIERMGYFEVQTHSKWDLMRVTEQLRVIEYAISGPLSGIPFLLRRDSQNVFATISGKRSRVEKSLLSIEVHPGVATKIIAAIQGNMLPSDPNDGEHLLLEAGDDLDVPIPMATKQHADKINVLRKQLDGSFDELTNEMLGLYGANRISELTESDADQFIGILEKRLAAAMESQF